MLHVRRDAQRGVEAQARVNALAPVLRAWLARSSGLITGAICETAGQLALFALAPRSRRLLLMR